MIGADGLASAFGDSGNGIVRSPDQRNFDIAIMKTTPFRHSETRNVEFRAEFFNTFNTPSFYEPVTGGNLVEPSPATGMPTFVPNSTFGQIQGTSVNPRIIQLALKLNF